MISKVVTGNTFHGACGYVCQDQRRAVVVKAEGVRDYDWKLMAADFERQHAMRPGLSKAVFHGIISFYPGEKIDDKMMGKIAEEYLEKMGIKDTQFAVVKHIDKAHPHFHIIANLVDNKGKAIKDNWIGLKGKKIAQELTLKYGLKEALSKDLSLTHMEALNGKDMKRYAIYQAITEKLPECRSLDELKNKLQEVGIETLYKYKGRTTELQGISFKIGDYKYKGSEVDRKFSVGNLQKTLSQQASIEIKQISQKPNASGTSLLPKIQQQEPKIPASRHSSLLEILVKPEQDNQQLPHQWKIEKKKKKQSRGLHL